MIGEEDGLSASKGQSSHSNIPFFSITRSYIKLKILKIGAIS